jgi:hypothetical protein
MDELTDQHRTALEWKYVDKLSVRDIAGRWEATEKSVESILFRARRELRLKLMKTDAAGDFPTSNEPAATASQLPEASEIREPTT